MINESTENESLAVNYVVVWREGTKNYDAVITEISRTGCYIKISGYTNEGLSAEFKVQLDSGHWISISGKISKTNYLQGFEVVFTNLTDYNKSLLGQFVFSPKKEPPTYTDGDGARSPRIIIADDDRTILNTLAAIVKDLGYTPVAFKDGLEVYNALKQDSDFAAGIFDMIMPNLEGLDLIRFMKNDPKLQSIPIGIITAQEDPKYWDESISNGADVFLPKPFSPPQIKMMIKMLFRKKISKPI